MTPDDHCHQLQEALNRARHSDERHILSEERDELKALAQKMPSNLEILKNGSRSQVGAYRLTNDREIVLKYYFPKNVFKKLRNRFVDTRCKRSWIAAHGFTHLGIPTPSALVIAEHFRFGLLNSMSVLATERAYGTPLRHLDHDRLEAVTIPLTEAFQTMAEFHIAHGDLKASNIIVSDQNEISFIDLDAAQFFLKGKTWDKARTYDRERFRKNWRDTPEASRILSPCID